MSSSQTAFGNESTVNLESVIATAELKRRPARAADYVAENRALIALAREMVASPDRILQKLVETALTLCHAGSAGISLLEPDGLHFHWPAVTGAWASHVGGGTPREYGPCGTVLDRNAPQLMRRPERHFTYLTSVTPGIEEALLIPFYIEGKAVGTIWVIAHDTTYCFEAEDLRVMTNLGSFAAAAYQMLVSTARTESTQSELQLSRGANESLKSDIREHTQTEAILADFSGRVMQAQDDERKRIARELHDTTGQVLAAIRMNLSLMQRNSSPENIVKFAECLDLIGTATSEIRNLSYLLHPPLMEELGLGPAITEYATGFASRSGLKITVEISNDVGRLQGNREIALFRIVQESLSNVHRHSGSPTVSISLFRDKQDVVLEIADQGRGMDRGEDGKIRYGVGLRSMQERLRPLGRALDIESSAAGTKLKIILPQPSAGTPE
jgi:signal transduction histidine kinase